MPRVLKDPTTEAPIVIDLPSRPCPKCGHVTQEGEAITKMFLTWWHHECAVKYLLDAGRDEAWRVLGQQLSDRPSHFGASATREIVKNLLRMGGAA
ncbi:MAG: hypothetical protein WAW17_29475 [Rhodococcus sp. (in: high G+C Gram-positive bacteria)]|uniref:hypothetical protein n=1 Tax=Rhodococcus sp. TaxID=1831 RepID=UPI003BB210FF